MHGLMIFGSIRAALAAGYHVYDRTDDGYVVRIRREGRWELAMVVARNGAPQGALR